MIKIPIGVLANEEERVNSPDNISHEQQAGELYFKDSYGQNSEEDHGQNSEESYGHYGQTYGVDDGANSPLETSIDISQLHNGLKRSI
ncbi:MAG: hypothetical protein F6K09_36220 [Merismopedia sp. SIO2A8]|nr:hypothetical protein [Merismopedia sp. SIO2A8]